MTNILMIAGDGGMFSGYRWQIWSGIGDRLYTGLFIHRDRDDNGPAVARAGSFILERHLLIDQQNFSHLPLEIRVAALQVVSDFVGLDLLCSQNALHGGFSCLRQRWEADCNRLLAYVPGQC